VTFDVIRAIEACYAPASDDAAWRQGVCEALGPLDRGFGRAVMSYDARDPAAFVVDGMAQSGNPRDLKEMAREFHRTASPGQVRGLYWRLPPFASLLATARSLDQETAALVHAFLERTGFPDLFAVHGAEPDHRGTIIGFGAEQAWRPATPLAHQLACLAAHLTTASRLRQALGGPAVPESSRTEAVLDPSGRVEDARGDAIPTAARARLGEAVRRVERARGRARRVSPGEAVELWRGLVDGTWSLVDHVEVGSRRTVLAVRNAPGVPDPRALTPRERDILGFALMGRSNKWIGYALGIAPSTVAEHLSRASRKLGARSRTELILSFGLAGLP
jgi:DNA-binding CsgD family transcriptional regulator